jgi:MFS family permease
MSTTTTAPPAPSATSPHPRPGWLLGVLLVGPFMAQADATMVNVATPSIRTGLGVSDVVLGLVVGGYLIGFAVLLITGARLGQTFGYRRVLILGVALFTVASLLCGLAPNGISLVAARIAQGFGAALMFPQTLTGIQLSFAGDQRNRAIALYAIALSSGALVGQILGGALISANLAGSGWRAIFLINVPVGVLLVAAALRHLPPDVHRTARRLDLAGVTVLCAAMLLLVTPLALGGAQGWPTWTWLCLCAAVPTVVGFFAVERRLAAKGGSPLVTVAVLTRPAVYWALITLMTATGTYYALLFTLAQYLQQGLGHSPLFSGLILVPWLVAFGLAGQLVRRLPTRTAPALPAAGCLLLGVCYAAISTALLTGRDATPLLTAMLGLGGLGLGIQFNALVTRLTTVVPASYASDVSGVSTTAIQIGGAAGVAALGTLYLGFTDHAGAGHSARAFALTTIVFAVLAFLASVTAYRATRAGPSGEETSP